MNGLIIELRKSEKPNPNPAEFKSMKWKQRKQFKESANLSADSLRRQKKKKKNERPLA